MPKIDISGWGEFRIGDLFTVRASKSVNKTYLNFDINGEYDFIGRTSTNNGVQGKLNKLNFEPNDKETYSVSQIGDNVCQYRENKWYSSQNIFILTPLNDEMNKAHKFITTLMTNTLKAVYGEDAYSHYPTLKTLKQMILKLPIDSKGNPDWQYMEDYMRNIEVRVSDSISKLESAQRVENSKIDVSGWGDFRIGDLFTQERGKESSPNRVEDGTLPMVNEINTNNGIAKFGKSSNVILGNCITVSVNYATNVFYQKNDFCASVNILVIRNTNMNEYSGKFIAGILSRNNLKYDYTNKISKDRLNDEFIKLPVDSKGNPDWQYMEDYMRNIEVRVSDSISKLESAKDIESSKIDVGGWGEFELRKLFGDCKKGSRLVQAERIDGDVPLVTAGYENVGITSNIGNANMQVFKDCISIDMFGNCFYRDYKFNADDNVLIFAENIKNKYVSMYIAGVVGKATSGYDYTNQYRINNYNRQEIKLPTTSSGNPDWLYMENYMKALETKVNDFLDKTT